MASIFDQALPGPSTNAEGESLERDPLSAAVGDTVKRQKGVSPEENPAGVGTVAASDEENAQLEQVLTVIERQIHGPHRDKLVDMLEATPELWLNVATASHTLLEGAYQKMASQGKELESDYWFGENGIIQSTVEMVYELAVAADTPNSNDSNQLDTAYMKTLQLVGEELFETDDVAAAEAEQMMVDLEFGEGASDLAAEGFALSDDVDDMLGEDMPAEAGPEMPPMMQGV